MKIVIYEILKNSSIKRKLVVIESQRQRAGSDAYDWVQKNRPDLLKHYKAEEVEEWL